LHRTLSLLAPSAPRGGVSDDDGTRGDEDDEEVEPEEEIEEAEDDLDEADDEDDGEDEPVDAESPEDDAPAGPIAVPARRASSGAPARIIDVRPVEALAVRRNPFGFRTVASPVSPAECLRRQQEGRWNYRKGLFQDGLLSCRACAPGGLGWPITHQEHQYWLKVAR
jgi:hypothetical protein